MERITRVSLTGFRGVREGAVDGLVDVNVLVGRNNSGKSTVVEAILRVAELLSSGRHDVADRSRGERLAALRSEPPWHPAMVHRNGPGPGRIELHTTDSPPLWMTFTATGAIDRNTVAPCCCANTTCFWPRDAYDAAIEKALWGDALRARRDKALAKHLSTIFGMDIESIQLPPDGRAVLLFPTHGLPLDSQGDGARAAFRALTLLGALNNTTLLMEEPECHQHPGSLKRFAQAITQLAKENSVQLILTTHSSECVGAFLDASTEVNSESAVFHLALRDGVLDARKLDAPTVATLAETGTDVRFLSLYGARRSSRPARWWCETVSQRRRSSS